MVNARILTKGAVKSIDQLLLGDHVTLQGELNVPNSTSPVKIPISFNVDGKTVLDAYVTAKEYADALDLINRSVERRRGEWLNWESSGYGSAMGDFYSATGISGRYESTVKVSTEALMKMGLGAMDKNYVNRALKILEMFVYDSKKKTRGMKLEGQLGEFAHKTLLPLAPTNKRLAKFVVQQYIREKQYSAAEKSMQGTPLANYAQKAVSEATVRAS